MTHNVTGFIGTFQSRARWQTFCVCLVSFVALAAFYYWPRDANLTTDSMEYLARRASSPLHPHHLLWVYVLAWGRGAAHVLAPALDPVQSGQLFQAIVSAAGAILFWLVIQNKGGLGRWHAALWALAFATSAGYRELAQETEAYNLAITLCLGSVLAAPPGLPPPDSPSLRRWFPLRFLAAVLLFCGAVCVHQLFALAAVPFLLYYWRPVSRLRLAGSGFVILAGTACLLAYWIAYRAQTHQVGFMPWLTLYSGQMPIFGRYEHLITPYFMHRLVANLMAATLYDPVPAIKAAAAAGGGVPLGIKALMAGGYLIWAALLVMSAAALLSANALARFFAAWYLCFELFLWYWAPWLLQMQVLAIPAAVGVAACYTLPAQCSPLPLRQWARAAVTAVLVLFSAANLCLQFAAPPRLGAVNLAEAKAFYGANPLLADDKSWLMLVYGYGASYPYAVLAGPSAAVHIRIIENRDPAWIQQKETAQALALADSILASGGPVLIHKSMLLTDQGECAVQSLITRLTERGQFPLHTRLLATPDGRPVALELAAAGLSVATPATDTAAQLRELATRATLPASPELCD